MAPGCEALCHTPSGGPGGVGQVLARSSAVHVQVRCWPGTGHVQARRQAGPGKVPARYWLRAPRWLAGEAIRRPLSINSHGDSGEHHACHGVVRATRRQAWHPTLGCDVDATSSESWRRGERPYATPPPVGPEGLDKCWPGPVLSTSRSGVSQVQDTFRLGARPVLARCRLGTG